MAQNPNTDGRSDSLTPATRLLNEMIGTSPVPRMLTPYEIELLQQSKREIADYVRQQYSQQGLISR